MVGELKVTGEVHSFVKDSNDECTTVLLYNVEYQMLADMICSEPRQNLVVRLANV